jgi:hypothetical protein
MGTQTQSYTYQSLTSPTSIRLLRLSPSPDTNAPLHGSLIHANLNDLFRGLISTYTAHSYVWGDRSQTGIIFLDSQEVAITLSLKYALRYIRDPTREFLIWADAICINQDDIAERSQQVEMMGRIYSTATHTTVFLGHLDAMSERMMRYVEGMETLAEKDASGSAAAGCGSVGGGWGAESGVVHEGVGVSTPKNRRHPC